MSIFPRRETDVAAAYDKYADMLYRISLSQLQHDQDAQDAVQDVFTKFITTLPEFSDPEHERAWFIRVTVNRCRDLLRRRKIRSFIALDEISELPASEQSLDSEQSADVMHRLASIPEKSRTAIVLHHLEGFSVEETAKTLGISVSAVKMRLSRGRELLKIRSEKEEDDV